MEITYIGWNGVPFATESGLGKYHSRAYHKGAGWPSKLLDPMLSVSNSGGSVIEKCKGMILIDKNLYFVLQVMREIHIM